MLKNYIIDPEIIDISINGTKIRTIKSFVDEHLITGDESFDDRYSFEIEGTINDPKQLFSDICEQIEYEGESEECASEDAIVFADKYLRNESIAPSIVNSWLTAKFIKINDIIKDAVPEKLKKYSEDITASTCSIHILCDLYSMYIHFGQQEYSVRELWYLHYLISKFDRIAYAKYIVAVFPNSPSFVSKRQIIKSLLYIMNDKLFNNIINAIFDDFEMPRSRYYYTRDWDKNFVKLVEGEKIALSNFITETTFGEYLKDNQSKDL